MPFYLEHDRPERKMKTTTIVYYSTNSALAKEVAAAERKAGRIGQTRDATTFYTGDFDPADSVIVLPDVARHHANKIRAAYGDRVRDYDPIEVVVETDPPDGTRHVTENVVTGKSPTRIAVHRGNGKWYVMDGENEISGPHHKEEAKSLAALP